MTSFLLTLVVSLFAHSVHSYSFVKHRSTVTLREPPLIISHNSHHGSLLLRQRHGRRKIVMSDNSKQPFTISSLFGKSSSSKVATDQKRVADTEHSNKIDPHPSVRRHINPLNLLYPATRARIASKALSSSGDDEILSVHPDVVSGILPNGFSYIILPNRSPPGRFEAHLQVFSGSADELEPQQGIAHLTEHVAYMGSRKRERLFGTGSQTNAYTDFHHTVFYAACPTFTPGTDIAMLPMALDALADVMEARVESARLEKERAAVLSEMTMVNTIEYRVECQILSTLHRENRLAKRFPIGKEVLIRNWKTDDVKTWHRIHYRPDNVLLYIVGDINVQDAERIIEAKFGGITSEKHGSEIRIPELKNEASLIADAIVHGENVVKSAQSWHYPPIVHEWCMPSKSLGALSPSAANLGNNVEVPDRFKTNGYDLQLQRPYELDEKTDFLQTEFVAPGKKIRPHIFRYVLDEKKTLGWLLFRVQLCMLTYFSSRLPLEYHSTVMSYYKLFLFIYLPSAQSNLSRT